MISQVFPSIPRIVTCKECGEKIEYTPAYCTNFPRAVPATPKGWIKMIFGKKIRKRETNIKFGVLYIECPVCGSDLIVSGD